MRLTIPARISLALRRATSSPVSRTTVATASPRQPQQQRARQHSKPADGAAAAGHVSIGDCWKRIYRTWLGHDPTSASTILIQRFLNYMEHVVVNKAGGTIDDLNRLHAFMSVLPAYFGARTIVIDGLTMSRQLKMIDKYDINAPIILVWREGVNILERFAQLIEEKKYIKVLEVTPNIREFGDLCAIYIALVTNGHLITNDFMIRHHLNDFDRYYENERVKVDLRSHFNVKQVLIERFWNYMEHVVVNKAGGTDDLNRLIAFLRHCNAGFGARTTVIDGLNMAWMLKHSYSFNAPIILVWREGVKIPEKFARLIERNAFGIDVLKVTPNISEFDDLCAMYIALVTNGQLITNDAIRNHFNDFDRYYENERVKVDLRSHLNVKRIVNPYVKELPMPNYDQILFHETTGWPKCT